jgi:hypothetical protein
VRRQEITQLAQLLRGENADQRAAWLKALVGRRQRLREYDHFPPNDAIDRRSGAQLFLHTHDVETHGFAHVHCFVRMSGAEFGLKRKVVMTHLAAIEVDTLGRPARLIAVNQWVTGEMWLPARRTLALLLKFEFNRATPEHLAGRWVSAVLRVFKPELKSLLLTRDARLQRALDRRPAYNVLEDRKLEIVAAKRINLPQRLKELGVTS